jgi:hypothetical protein
MLAITARAYVSNQQEGYIPAINANSIYQQSTKRRIIAISKRRAPATNRKAYVTDQKKAYTGNQQKTYISNQQQHHISAINKETHISNQSIGV